MWVIRQLNPWQDQTRFYEGNLAVFFSDNMEEISHKKNELELYKIRGNPFPNFYEYWDVVCDKQLIKLHNYLIRKFNFKILDFDHEIEEKELNMDEILHGVYPDDRFADEDLLEIQNYINVYYYKLDSIQEKDKYFMIANPYSDVDFLDEMTFKFYDNEKDVMNEKSKLSNQEEVTIIKV